MCIKFLLLFHFVDVNPSCLCFSLLEVISLRQKKCKQERKLCKFITLQKNLGIPQCKAKSPENWFTFSFLGGPGEAVNTCGDAEETNKLSAEAQLPNLHLSGEKVDFAKITSGTLTPVLGHMFSHLELGTSSVRVAWAWKLPAV